MCESENINRAMLQEHVGKDVTIILNSEQNSVFQGVLDKQSLSIPVGEYAECFVLTAERGLMPRGHETVAVPQTKIYFLAQNVRAIVVPQETEAEAAAIIEGDKRAVSLASPGWGQAQ